MKKVLVFLAVVFFSATMFATEQGDFVKTNDGTFFFKKVKFGLNSYVVGIKENGEKVKFNKCEILAYAKNGQEFEKKPVYKENKPTGEEAFMAVITYRNGMRLYEYEYVSKESKTTCRRYYIFKAEKFIVEMDNINKPTLTAFFNVK